MYLLCRHLQLFTIKVAKNKREETRVTEYVTGFTQLPEAGGMLDQPVRLMAFFDYFRGGENARASKTLKG